MSRMLRYLRRRSLRTKLFIATSSGTVFVVAVGSLILFVIMHGFIDRDIKSHLSNSTTSILNLVRTSVTTAIRNHLRAVAEKNHEIVAHFYGKYQQGLLGEEEAKARATEVLLSQTIGQTGYVFCIDTYGIIRVHPNTAMRGVDISRDPLSRILADRKEGYVEYDWANLGEPVARPKALYMVHFEPWDWIISASAYRDEFKGFVNVDDFRKSVLAHSFGETGYSFVMDEQGTFIIHPKLEGVSVKTSVDPKGKSFPQDLLEKDSGAMLYEWVNPGEEQYRGKIAVFERIPELGWIVASTGYLDEVNRPLSLLKYVVVGTTLAMLLLLFFLSWWVGKVATRPLPLLMQTFDEGARGNLSDRMDESLGGEFGQLANYYNRFMESLEASRDQLAESEEKYRTIFEQAVEGMFQIHPAGTLIDVNPAMAHIFGYSGRDEMLAEVTDVATQVFADPSDREELYEELFQDGKVVGKPFRLLRRDGSVFWGEMSERLVRVQNGDVIHVEGIIKDVTAQREFLERLSKAKEDAESASQLKSEFLVMVSHEMRTPLTSMLGFSRMVKKQLQSRFVDVSGPACGDCVQTIQRAIANLDVMEAESSRLAKLIHDMLDFARLAAGDLIICLKPVSPGEMAARAVEEMAEFADRKGLFLEMTAGDDLPLVKADEERVLQVIKHLLSNAIKFTSSGGVFLNAAVRDGEVEFLVRDSGAGISPEFLEHIFDHFVQLGDVLTDKPQGLGLGLAFCRSIVALHQGRIWVESEQGKGSVFYFTLPVAHAEAP